jgi:hypothetical protein
MIHVVLLCNKVGEDALGRVLVCQQSSLLAVQSVEADTGVFVNINA